MDTEYVLQISKEIMMQKAVFMKLQQIMGSDELQAGHGGRDPRAMHPLCQSQRQCVRIYI